MKRTFWRKLKSTRTEYDGLLGYTEERYREMTPAEFESRVRACTTIDELEALCAERVEESQRALARAQQNANPWPRILGGIREWAAQTLRKAGLPDDRRPVVVREDGTWTELPEGWEGWSGERRSAYLREHRVRAISTVRHLVEARHQPYVSLEWRAVELLKLSGLLEVFIEKGDVGRVAEYAYRLGAQEWQALFAEHYELAAAIGMAQQRKSSGRKPGTRARQRAWQAAADALRAQHPDWSKSALAREIAKTHGGSAHTIRQRIR
jgi:hypothetical protein